MKKTTFLKALSILFFAVLLTAFVLRKKWIISDELSVWILLLSFIGTIISCTLLGIKSIRDGRTESPESTIYRKSDSKVAEDRANNFSKE